MSDFLSGQKITMGEREENINFPQPEVIKKSQSDEAGKFEETEDEEIKFKNVLVEHLSTNVDGIAEEEISEFTKNHKINLTDEQIQEALKGLVADGTITEDDDVKRGKIYIQDTFNKLQQAA